MRFHQLLMGFLTCFFFLAGCDRPPKSVTDDTSKDDGGSYIQQDDFENFLSQPQRHGELNQLLQQIVQIYFISEVRLKDFDRDLMRAKKALQGSRAWQDLQVYRALETKFADQLTSYYLRLVKVISTKRPNQRVKNAKRVRDRFENQLKNLAGEDISQLALYDIGVTLRRKLYDYYKSERHWAEPGIEFELERRLGPKLLRLISSTDDYLRVKKDSVADLEKRSRGEVRRVDPRLAAMFKQKKKEFFGKTSKKTNKGAKFD